MMISLEEIIIGVDRRAVNESKVDELVDSIKETGLIHKPAVRKIPDGHYKLVAGGHRIAALRKLGMSVVEVDVLPEMDDIDARIAELDENLMRNNPNVIEYGLQMAERKRLYELKHPEARVDEAKKRKVCTADFCGTKTFVKDMSEKLGKSERAIQASLQVSHLTPEEANVFQSNSCIQDEMLRYLSFKKSAPAKATAVFERMKTTGERYNQALKSLEPVSKEALLKEKVVHLTRVAEIDKKLAMMT